MLPALAERLAIRDGPVLTIDEAVERSGLSVDQVRLLARAAGLPDPEPGARVLTEGFVALAEGMNAVTAVFGEDVAFQLLRVFGSSMARVADAVVSAFLVNVEPGARREEGALGIARANVEAAALLPGVASVLDLPGLRGIRAGVGTQCEVTAIHRVRPGPGDPISALASCFLGVARRQLAGEAIVAS